MANFEGPSKNGPLDEYGMLAGIQKRYKNGPQKHI